jgi:hypothetical protein
MRRSAEAIGEGELQAGVSDRQRTRTLVHGAMMRRA